MHPSSNRVSLYTESTVPSTVWGPGTLAGRAILALGEATLKGLDRILDRESRAIQKRFAVIRASVPHLTPEMYSDLIELSRPYLYPQNILEQASDILFHQLHLGYGAAIALSVAQLSLSEARLLVFRMLTSRQLEIYDDISDIANGPLAPRSALDFLATLVQVRPEMKSACFEVLDELVRNPHVCVRFRDHPILRIHAEENLNIPLICRTPLAELQLRFSQDHMYRWKNWKLLESAGLSPESRLLQISTVLLSAVSESWYWTPDFFDAAVDLFDFLRYSPVPELRETATDHLVVCISATRDSWEPLSVVLDCLSRFAMGGDRTIIQSLSLRYGPYTPKSPSFVSKTHTKTPSEQLLEFHPQLREFLRYAHLRPHARDAHLQFCNSHPQVEPTAHVATEPMSPNTIIWAI
ncbi:hypothetical protein MVEN_00271800 [Mycena venus]|uniref:Uncharacterized protein n=1 Tax=Mycena venus TaxID=2733690 RepID=A0A8H6Z538_9AGAR|nr:hypothetical protein MVEN_00271800 [Mycena venus]